MLTSNKGGAVLTRSSKRNERTNDLTRISKNARITYATRSSAKKNRICNEGEPAESLISGDLHQNTNQGVPSELREQVASNLSKSVVSVALCDGQTVLFAFSGIPVQRLGNVTRFLTSARLAQAFNDKKKDHDDLKVLVRHGDKLVTGYLDNYNLSLNIAAVNVMDLSDLHIVHFAHGVKFLPHSTVVAIGRDIEGNLISTDGVLNDDKCESPYMSSSCKISEVCEGGPLFDIDGYFVGINLCLGTETTLYLPLVRAYTWFKGCRPLRNIVFPGRDGLNKNDLESLGYPERLNDGMILYNTFEEPFGDEFGKGVWSELSETTSGILERNIVALASFLGEKRFFACTGLFIQWNGCTTILTSASLLRKSGYKDQQIDKNLRIKVFLPNKELAEGTLQHVNLHYNVALVSVKDFCVPQPTEVQHRWPDSGEVLAVGRCFRSGSLMVARGHKYPRPEVSFDCKYLAYSTCKITKAGIGGPLLDLDGKFVGMNFYDQDVRDTPHLSWWEILPLLEYFKTKRTVAEGGDYGNPPSDKPDWTKEGDESVFCNRWPVPSPCWYDPDVREKLEIIAQSRVPRYTFEFEFPSDTSESKSESSEYESSESESE